jgi:pyruvate/2-oxoglutarate dehydrogenase complex dihydrolipoamide acyltransferase (E2) component
MNRLALLALPLTLCLACSREEPAPDPAPAPAAPAADSAAAPAPAPAPATRAAAAAPSDPASGFDAGAFSGTFAGGGLRLELHADGTYGLEASDGATQGTWTHEAATGAIRLDPGSKTAQDRVFRMQGRDALVDGATTLTRQAAS